MEQENIYQLILRLENEIKTESAWIKVVVENEDLTEEQKDKAITEARARLSSAIALLKQAKQSLEKGKERMEQWAEDYSKKHPPVETPVWISVVVIIIIVVVLGILTYR